MALAMALAKLYWTNDSVLMAYFFGGESISTFTRITLVQIAMRLCSPAVAATQFTIYMAMANFGRLPGLAARC